jgi:magnesium transporter
MADFKEIDRLLASGKADDIQKIVDDMHPADVLEALKEEDGGDYKRLLVLPDDYLADVIDEADDDDKYEILKVMEQDRMMSVLNRMSVDEIADLIQELEDDDKDDAVKSLLRGRTKTDVTNLLKYDEDTAGGIMTTQFIAIYASNTVMKTLNYLKTEVDAEVSYYLYVVNKEDYKLLGVVSLHDLVLAPFDTLISEIMNTSVISVSAGDDQEEVAEVFSKYGFPALPVVDGDGRMIGIVTADDVIDVINEEATEDIHHMGGVNKEEKIDGTVLDSVKSRLPWLVVNLVTAILASSVIDKFSSTIAQIVALSAVMTIISGMGGNAGTQSLTMVVRALSLGEINKENGRSILLKEICAGVLNGIVIGALVAVIAMFYDYNPWFGLVAGVAMLLNMVCAALAGFLIPIILEKVNIDPAIASSVFVTTVTDCMGFFLFLGLATIAMPLLK